MDVISDFKKAMDSEYYVFPGISGPINTSETAIYALTVLVSLSILLIARPAFVYVEVLDDGKPWKRERSVSFVNCIVSMIVLLITVGVLYRVV